MLWVGRFPLLLYGGGILLLTVLLAGGFAAKAQADGLNAWGLASMSLLLLLCARSSCGGPGKLAGDPADHAALFAAPRLFQGHPGGPTHPGRGPDHAEQRARQSKALTQESGSPFSGQPGQKPAFRAADGFQRRCRGNAARRRLPDASGSARHRGLEQEAPKCDGRLFLPFPPATTLQSSGTALDGPTNESAGKLADLNSLLRAGEPAPFALIVGDASVLVGGEVRYHS